MANLIDRIVGFVVNQCLRTEIGIVTSRNDSDGSYKVIFKGTEVGPVWSFNDVKHEPGKQVQLLVRGSTVVGVLP